MKRRTFTFGLAALGAAPAIPSVAISAPISGATSTHFGIAKILARSHNHCSINMLRRHLRIDHAAAKELERMLLEQGIITRPIGGISMAANPTNTNCVLAEAHKPTNVLKSARDIHGRIKKLAGEDEAEKEHIQNHAIEKLT